VLAADAHDQPCHFVIDVLFARAHVHQKDLIDRQLMSRGLGWRIHESVEDTKLSTNKQHTLSIHASSTPGALRDARVELRHALGHGTHLAGNRELWIGVNNRIMMMTLHGRIRKIYN
jgi:hypothetical protein